MLRHVDVAAEPVALAPTSAARRRHSAAVSSGGVTAWPRASRSRATAAQSSRATRLATAVTRLRTAPPPPEAGRRRRAPPPRPRSPARAGCRCGGGPWRRRRWRARRGARSRDRPAGASGRRPAHMRTIGQRSAAGAMRSTCASSSATPLGRDGVERSRRARRWRPPAPRPSAGARGSRRRATRSAYRWDRRRAAPASARAPG